MSLFSGNINLLKTPKIVIFMLGFLFFDSKKEPINIDGILLKNAYFSKTKNYHVTFPDVKKLFFWV